MQDRMRWKRKKEGGNAGGGEDVGVGGVIELHNECLSSRRVTFFFLSFSERLGAGTSTRDGTRGDT